MTFNAKKKKRRLLFVNGSLNVGGVEKSLTDLLCNLDYDVYDVDLLLLESVGTYASLLPSQIRILSKVSNEAYGPLPQTIYHNFTHFKWRNIVFRLITILSSLLGIWVLKILRPVLGLRKKYDFAIAYRVGMANVVVSTIVKADRKLCWWHNGECSLSKKQTKKVQALWNQMDAIVTVSQYCKQMLLKHFTLHENNIFVVPNSIDIAKINELAGNTSPYGNITDLIFVTLGRLCWEKHIEDVPDIAKCLLDDGIKDFKWFIIGDGSKREEITYKIKKNNLENKVKILGYISNPYPYLKYADVMVHTSYIESQCLAVLESMVLKTPCVITKTIIPLDYPINDVNCLLAEQNIYSQAECLIRIIKGDVDNHVLTENAYKMVMNVFSRSKICQQIDQLFN